MQDALRGEGHRIRMVELQSELIFSTFEPVVRFVLNQAAYCQFMVLNMRHVVSLDDVSLGLMMDLQNRLAESGVELVICNAGKFADGMVDKGFQVDELFVDDDAALEYCENKLLLGLLGAGNNAAKPVALRDTFLLHGLADSDLAWLDSHMPLRVTAAGEHVIRTDEPSDCLYLLLEGSIEVYLPSPSGGKAKRLDVFEAGRTFGEMGFLDGSERSADVIALETSTYRELSRELYERLGKERPDIKIHLLEQLSRQLAASVRKANIEMAAFRG